MYKIQWNWLEMEIQIQLHGYFSFALAFYALKIIKMPTVHFGFCCSLAGILNARNLKHI